MKHLGVNDCIRSPFAMWQVGLDRLVTFCPGTTGIDRSQCQLRITASILYKQKMNGCWKFWMLTCGTQSITSSHRWVIYRRLFMCPVAYKPSFETIDCLALFVEWEAVWDRKLAVSLESQDSSLGVIHWMTGDIVRKKSDCSGFAESSLVAHWWRVLGSIVWLALISIDRQG